jgi:hypothetical protein
MLDIIEKRYLALPKMTVNQMQSTNTILQISFSLLKFGIEK